MLHVSLHSLCLLPFICIQLTIAQSRWPQGTVASGSTQILGDKPWNDTYAIDGDKSTMWIDATENDFPDILIIAMPEVHDLSGVTVLSNAAGWPTHYIVESLSNNTSWGQVAEVRDIPSFISTVQFAKSIKALQFRITVYNASTAPGQEVHTRINEVYPLYANETTSVAITASHPDRIGTIIGTVISVCTILAIILGILYLARRRRSRGQPQIWDSLFERIGSLATPPTDSKLTQEVSDDDLRAELDAFYKIVRKEIKTFRTYQGNELAGSNMPVSELAAVASSTSSVAYTSEETLPVMEEQKEGKEGREAEGAETEAPGPTSASASSSALTAPLTMTSSLYSSSSCSIDIRDIPAPLQPSILMKPLPPEPPAPPPKVKMEPF